MDRSYGTEIFIVTQPTQPFDNKKSLEHTLRTPETHRVYLKEFMVMNFKNIFLPQKNSLHIFLYPFFRGFREGTQGGGNLFLSPQTHHEITRSTLNL